MGAAVGIGGNDDEVRFRVERQRWAFRLAVALLGVVTGMYWIVAPVASLFGRHVELPDGRVAFGLVMMAGMAVWQFNPKDIAALMAGIDIRIGRKAGKAGDDD